MNYYSTNRKAPIVGFEEALLNGLAPDGGLYYPTEIPAFSAEEVRAIEAIRAQVAPLEEADNTRQFLQYVAFHVLQKWFGDEIDLDALNAIAIDAQSFPMPIRRVGEINILELFHGPTMAFKDVAARNLARIMNYFLRKRGKQAILLVATSGDTGGAIAHGFANQEAIQVVVLYPKGKVSRLQEEQLTRVANNITSLEVEGVFDDCQALVKQAFVDPELSHLPLTSANSINIARLIPQAIYYAYTYFMLNRSDLELVVPSGNFGNLTAGLFTKEMGIPISQFIAATNHNDAAARYYRSGEYEARSTIPTLSNAMDVGRPSNFVRVLELFGHNHERFCQYLRAYRITDQETIRTIQTVYQTHNYLLCPHTAVGWTVATRHADPTHHPVVIATADPIKFAQEIYNTTGIHVDNDSALQQLQQQPKRKTTIPNQLDALKEIVLGL